MKNSTAIIVRKLLIDLGHVSLPLIPQAEGLWPCYVGKIGDTPAQLLLITDTSGFLQGRIQSTGKQVEKPGFQILLRTLDYEAGWLKLNEIVLALEGIKRTDGITVLTTAAEYRLDCFNRTTPPIPLNARRPTDLTTERNTTRQTEERGRQREMFTVNYIASITELE